MSEYQYYEWQTIDRPLTAAERSAVNKLSSHIDVSNTSASVEYHWGDFKHDPIQVLTQYFDAFLYFANWGSEQLAFRLPRRLVDEKQLQPYMWTECVDLTAAGDYYVLSFFAPEDDSREWDENGARLGDLTALRQDILQGDLRAVYLGWLMGAVADTQNDYGDFNDYLDEDDEANEDMAGGEFGSEIEPPVPPGLSQLTAALETFVRFFRIDPFLVASAAQESAPMDAADSVDLEKQIAKLSQEERDLFLRRLLHGEPNVQLQVRRRLEELAGARKLAAPRGRRTVGQILATAEQLRAAAARSAKAAAQAQRIQELQNFAPQAGRAWQTVEAEIGRKNANGYDHAVALLVKLRDLAVYQNELLAFQARLAALLGRYNSRRAFEERVEKARLLAG